MFRFQAKKAAKLEKFLEKQQKKPTDAKESKPKEPKGKPAKAEAAAKDVVVGELPPRNVEPSLNRYVQSGVWVEVVARCERNCQQC